jgi:hypothetical protein
MIISSVAHLQQTHGLASLVHKILKYNNIISIADIDNDISTQEPNRQGYLIKGLGS